MTKKPTLNTSLNPFFNGLFWFLSLGLCLAIFAFIPALNYNQFLAQTKVKKTFTTEVYKPTEMKKRKTQTTKPNKPQQKKAKSSKKSGKAKANSRFTMDLGPASSLGGRSGGVAVGGGPESGDAAYSQGETDTDAQLLRSVPPKYPKAAQEAGVRGLVRCLITVGENGRVVGLEFLEKPGAYGFVEVIEEALRQWVYEPATIDGVPVRQKIEQPFKF